jgi:hypothetical protein
LQVELLAVRSDDSTHRTGSNSFVVHAALDRREDVAPVGERKDLVSGFYGLRGALRFKVRQEAS